MPDDPAIRAVGLTKRFRSGEGELVVFAGLDLEIRRGEQLALVGESGAGKSTLLYLLGGLERPSQGQIFFNGDDLTGLPETALAEFRNRAIGFVWQGHHLLPEFTALENVMMPLLIRGLPRAQAEPAARARLEEVGLAGRATHRAGELSGGEQQRAALARALAGDPRVLLADEPTGNLDFKTGDMIIALLAELHRAHGLTSLCVTHNMAFARRCDRILKLEAGRLAPLETPAPSPLEGGNAYV
ncbi:MAG: ABC transporter ATP-binding protein [Acidobacteria bacterium]|nr:ABC transporter ATP-binding protein [Acidobacteriota bacterium]